MSKIMVASRLEDNLYQMAAPVPKRDYVEDVGDQKAERFYKMATPVPTIMNKTSIYVYS
jgi:hypothetical protein